MNTYDFHQSGNTSAACSDQSHAFPPNVPEIAPRSALSSVPATIGPFRVERKLGAGGMGAVYLGVDSRDLSEVAIKVMSESVDTSEASLNRFRKESRLLSEIKHPHVTGLREIGEYNNRLYLAMEFVAGVDLKALLQHQKRLPERFALRIVRDIADALGFAHGKGIIHRDIKPANILLACENTKSETSDEIIESILSSGQHPTVKLTDFGLARHINQTESLALTQTGAMLGTPYYLSPEQCADADRIGTATDIYSLGVTLFEMLAGRPPFEATDPVNLIKKHCFEPVPDLRKLAPEVSDRTASLVQRCLQKSPRDRYADGAHLARDIETILRGDVHDVSSHPVLPSQSDHLIEENWEWDLECSPEQLWPYVSNTERINNAIGLPAVDYVTERDQNGSLQKIGSFRLGWAKLTWLEHPFEWIEGKRLGVVREYLDGPFEWFSSIVELHPRGEGGSRLVHRVQVSPRGRLGRLLGYWTVTRNGRKSLNRLYPQIDSRLKQQTKQRLPEIDPFVDPVRPSKRVSTRLQQRVDDMLGNGADPASVDVLHKKLREASSQEIARIRPFALAETYGLDRGTFTDTCLLACEHGLLEMHWDILCPTCRISSTVRETIEQINSHEYCQACDHDFEVDFQNALELIFRPHPEIRSANLKTYCAGGPEHSPHVVSQIKLEPGEQLDLELQLDAGNYTLRGPQLPYSIPLRVLSEAATATATITLSSELTHVRPLSLQPERQFIEIENSYEKPVLLRLERTIRNVDVLTAGEASRIERFKQIFPEQVLSPRQLTGFSTCTILGVRLLGVESLFENSGDTSAFQRLDDLRGQVKEIATGMGGEVVKEQEDRLMIVLRDKATAVELAGQLLKKNTQDIRNGVTIGLAMHRGNALATTMNGRLDYVGRAISKTGLLLQNVTDNSLTLSPDIRNDAEIQHDLGKLNLKAGRDEDLYVSHG